MSQDQERSEGETAVPAREEFAELKAAHAFLVKQFKIMQREKEHGWREADRFETRLDQAREEIARLRAAEDLESRLANYLAVRRLALPDVHPSALLSTQAQYVLGEAEELGLAAALDDIDATRHELADVVLACTVLARHLGTTVEACIEEKTEADRGRG